MKLIFPCATCSKEHRRQNGNRSRLEYRDDGRYESTCSLGHVTITVIQQQKCEILFEIGAHAILDGYYREAITSFTSSLERFYEFVIRVLLETSGSSDAVFKSSWKQVSNQSERQTGALIFLWAYCLNESIDLLSNSQVSLRNEVIHKGKIPTKAEAIKYGNAVLDVLRPKLNILQEKYPNEVMKIIRYHLQDVYGTIHKCKQTQTACIPTIFNISAGESLPQQDLEESLLVLSNRRQRLMIRNGAG